jgi:MFS family permease
MSGVIAAISFGMLGLFLPLVIFLQSVLGLDALHAGLALAPMSLASIFSAPVGGRLADRYGGKDALIAGLLLWAGGIGLVLQVTRLYINRTELIIGLVVAGLGLGLTFAPLQSIAMRNVVPNVASSAAGLINTSRQMGALLGSAVTGAVLQTQLAARLGSSARENVQSLPDHFHKWLIEGFEKAAATGRDLAVGVGQTGAHLPADLPASVRPAIEQVASKTFYDAYIPTMRITLIIPVAVLVLALIGALFARSQQRTATPAETAPGAAE